MSANKIWEGQENQGLRQLLKVYKLKLWGFTKYLKNLPIRPKMVVWHALGKGVTKDGAYGVK